MKDKLIRWFYKTAFNLWPSYRGSGARVEYIAPDYKEIGTRIRLGWRTRNYVGTLFGGSMFAMADPMYMIILMKNLGDDYVVWDKSATIKFKRPGTGTVRAVFRIEEAELQKIRAEVDEAQERDYVFTTELVNKEGKVVAEVEKLLYIARKAHYKLKRKQRTNQAIAA